MWNSTVERGRAQTTMWIMRIACWIPKATNTHTSSVTLTNFPLQHERASMLRYTYIVCLSVSLSNSISVLRKDQDLIFVILGFRNKEDDICALLGYYAAQSCNSVTTFRDYLSGPTLKVQKLEERLLYLLRWDRQVVLKRRYGITVLRCVLSLKGAHHMILIHDVNTFYVLLTVHLDSILVNNQLDAQFFFRVCLFNFSRCFEHPCAHHQGNQLY
jgi:hypothetical protein